MLTIGKTPEARRSVVLRTDRSYFAPCELRDALRRWNAAGRRVALATVTQIDGSAPVSLGPAFAVNDAGKVAGSIGGGCMEGALIAEARTVLRTDEPVVLTYGSGDGLVDVASLCGGTLTLELAVLTQSMFEALADEGVSAASLYLVGANAYAAALVPIARQIGYDVQVVDPRPVFLASRDFPGAATVLGWPEDAVPTATLCQRDAVVVLAHDERLEGAFLARVLSSGDGYVGALGSRNAHAERLARLRAEGVSETNIARLAAPVGLDLGGNSAAEVAVSIAAEMIAVRHARTAGRLMDCRGPIHS